MLLAQVNHELADISNKLIYSAMAVYTLAMFAQMFEWTFGAKGGVAVRSRRQATLAESVTDSADAAKGVRKVSVTVASQGGGTTTLTRTALADAGATTVTSGRGDDDGPADGLGPAGTSEKADMVGRIAVSLTVLGLLLHTGGVITRGLSVMRWPWGNMYEFSVAFALMMVGSYAVLLATKKNVRWLGLPVVITVLLILGIAVSVLYTESEQLVPALHSYWLGIHVSTATICGGAFFAAFVATGTYLIKDRHEHRLAAGLTVRAANLMDRLPAASTLDKLSYRINALVFPLWTFTIIAGAIWAEAAWGKYWEWDPKETWSFITWVAYAAYLHARATAGWRGRKAAYLALLAFACWLFNFYGVNIFITGKHSYAGV
ncbi:c-type cytochrome biogenesis protein CcsB [Kitasatospora sp. NPDC004531]